MFKNQQDYRTARLWKHKAWFIQFYHCVGSRQNESRWSELDHDWPAGQWHWWPCHRSRHAPWPHGLGLQASAAWHPFSTLVSCGLLSNALGLWPTRMSCKHTHTQTHRATNTHTHTHRVHLLTVCARSYMTKSYLSCIHFICQCHGYAAMKINVIQTAIQM